MANPKTGTSKCVTAQYPFLRCNADGDHLLNVRAGVSVEDALNQACCFIDAAKGVADALGSTDNGDTSPAWAVVHLNDISKAIVGAVISSLAQERLQGGAV